MRVAVAAVLAFVFPTFAADHARTSARCSGGAVPTVAFTRPLPGKPGPMLLRKQTLWVAIRAVRAGRPGRLLRVDARSGRVEKTFWLPIDPYRLAAGFGSLWITGETKKRTYSGVLRLDPRSGRVVDVIRRARTLWTALATSTNAVW